MAELIIEPGRTESQYWRDLWHYRELFYVLAWRDIMVRYKQTAVGVLWALLTPLVNTVLLTVTFEYFAKLPSVGGAPYPIMVLAGSLPWTLFANSLGGSSQSVLSNSNLISKVYFPRMIIPAGAVVTAMADLMIALTLLVPMMAYFHFWPTWRLLALPLFILLGFVAAMGPGLLLTALTVKYRDFRYITPFIVQVGALASPVGYSVAIVAAKGPLVYMLYSLNPMVGVIEGFRWCILGGQSALDATGFMISLSMNFFLMLTGIWYFRKVERSFADVL
jgi:lipopolysaccharide transport system permease protein